MWLQTTYRNGSCGSRAGKKSVASTLWSWNGMDGWLCMCIVCVCRAVHAVHVIPARPADKCAWRACLPILWPCYYMTRRIERIQRCVVYTRVWTGDESTHNPLQVHSIHRTKTSRLETGSRQQAAGRYPRPDRPTSSRIRLEIVCRSSCVHVHE